MDLPVARSEEATLGNDMDSCRLTVLAVSLPRRKIRIP